MPVTLIVMGHKQHGRRIPVRIPEFRIGRDPDCHLRPASKDVDWVHCAILTRDNGVFLRDERSRLGTMLNRRRLVGGEMQLGDGDLIEIVPLTFQVAIAENVAPPATEHEEASATRVVTVAQTSVRSSATPLPATRLVPPRMRDAQEMLCPN